MKLLLDQNISRRIVPALLEFYPGTTQVYLENLAEADDMQIWEFAKKNDFTIVTKDSDFHEFSLLLGPPPKILWLKCGNQTNQFILEALLSMSDKITQFEKDPDIACLEIYK